jgi:hypothetical protein
LMLSQLRVGQRESQMQSAVAPRFLCCHCQGRQHANFLLLSPYRIGAWRTASLLLRYGTQLMNDAVESVRLNCNHPRGAKDA